MTAHAPTAPIRSPLVAGNYIVHAIMPTDPTDTRACNPAMHVQATRTLPRPKGAIPARQTRLPLPHRAEEDVNVDLGNQFTPQIPPPPCVGDDHVLDQSTLVTRSPYYGDPTCRHPRLCATRSWWFSQNRQNANADFNMMTNFRTDPNGDGPNDTRDGRCGGARPRRRAGLQRHLLRAQPDVRLVRRAAADRRTSRSASTPGWTPCPERAIQSPFDPNSWRLIKTLTTSADGAYEILLPSTETFNCPIPQGPCPGMYIAIVDDPGTKEHPNPNYNPNLLTANTPFEVWPGLTTQLDTPVDPISGTACEDPAGGTNPDPSAPALPDLLQVSRPYVLAGDTGAAAPDHDPGRLHRYRRADRRDRRTGQTDRLARLARRPT